MTSHVQNAALALTVLNTLSSFVVVVLFVVMYMNVTTLVDELDVQFTNFENVVDYLEKLGQLNLTSN